MPKALQETSSQSHSLSGLTSRALNEGGLFHRVQSAWSSLQNENTLQITLRCGAGELTKVDLISFPRYGAGAIEYPECPMQPILRDAQYDYYQCTLGDIPVKRFAYYFRLRSQHSDTDYAYTEMGLRELEPLITSGRLHSYSFEIPYFNNIDIHYVPDWAKGALAYQIFPDRFARSSADKAASSPSTPPWNSPPTRDIMLGGSLAGIGEKLSHLEDLGVELLYLNPTFLARSNHKYDTSDYKQVDPAFGTNEDLRLLVQKCHQRGIRVVLDAVFNHCGPNFPAFVHASKHGAASPYWDWFHMLPQNQKTNRDSVPEDSTDIWSLAKNTKKLMDEQGRTMLPYETFAFAPSMPKLNTKNPELKAYLLEVAEYWIREYDIDGWRLDVANEVDHVFWREFRQRVHAAKSDALIVGEIWHDAGPWLHGEQFDCVMNYPFQHISFDFFLEKSIGAARAKELFNALFMRYSPQVNQAQWNMLDSHDTPRLIHRCDGDVAKVKLLLGLMLCYIGSPVIYYGSEIGLDGADDPDCRRSMPWEKEVWNCKILEHVQQLARLRKQHSVLRSGALRWLETSNDEVLGFERFSQKQASCELSESGESGEQPAQSRYVIFNRSEEPQALEALSDWKNLAGRKNLLNGQAIAKTIAPKEMLVL